jgi:hypothetical protein
MKTEIRELGDIELDAVSGGFMRLPLVAVKVLAASKGSGGDGGTSGQNDPAQMFQQILQQLTQGQGQG